jgi:hypothetical protein
MCQWQAVFQIIMQLLTKEKIEIYMLYKVRRYECGNLSNTPSWEDIAKCPELNSAEQVAKGLFLLEFGGEQIAPFYFYESLAEHFEVDLPKSLAVNAGFPMPLIQPNGDIDDLLDEWWELESQFIGYPYWEIIELGDDDITGDDDGDSRGFITPEYCISDNKLFLYMNNQIL